MRRFISSAGWNPSGPELLAFVRERGSRRTIHRDLDGLRKADLVANVGRRWRITAEGFAYLGLRAIVARKSPPKKKVARLTKQQRREKRLRRQFDGLRLDNGEALDLGKGSEYSRLCLDVMD